MVGWNMYLISIVLRKWINHLRMTPTRITHNVSIKMNGSFLKIWVLFPSSNKANESSYAWSIRKYVTNFFFDLFCFHFIWLLLKWSDTGDIVCSFVCSFVLTIFCLTHSFVYSIIAIPSPSPSFFHIVLFVSRVLCLFR
jgi:hypothetical protein